MTKVSFNNPLHDKEGFYYRQRIKIDTTTLDKLRDIVESEISLGYPNRLKYTFGDNDLIFLKRLYVKNNVCFLILFCFILFSPKFLTF